MLKRLSLTVGVALCLAGTMMAQELDRKSEVQIVFTSLRLRSSTGEGPVSVGGRYVYNFNSKVALDTEVNYFPRNSQNRFGQTQALAGIKAGKRWETIGLFAKARAGLIHFPKDTYEVLGNDQPTKPVVDIGAVFELYTGKRWLVRADAGDTIIPFGNDRFPASSGGLRQPGTSHSLQMSFGVGYRF